MDGMLCYVHMLGSLHIQIMQFAAQAVSQARYVCYTRNVSIDLLCIALGCNHFGMLQAASVLYVRMLIQH